jgi:hypothetical protein
MSLLKVNSVTDLGGDTPAGVGRILQVVSTTKTDTFVSSSISAGSFADITGLSVSITPISSSSKIFIVVNVNGGASGGSIQGALALRMLRNSTAICVGDTAGIRTPITATNMLVTTNSDQQYSNVSFNFLDSPNTTSALTYKVQAGNVLTSSSSQVLYVNRHDSVTDSAGVSRSASTITVMEVAG